MEELVADLRSYRLDASKEDGYEKNLRLFSFDVKNGWAERIFWKPGSKENPYIFGRCSIGSPFPQCRFEMYSQKLSAMVSVGFSMEHIEGWWKYLSLAESQLNHYKYASLRGKQI
ncbi:MULTISPECIES: hypothetical protein [Pseudomonas]|uniref:Uncharacterized protein n=1 Tax=Pseudomonas quercus TaxID=2722792 RepID=A0ABX0YLH9_9PSED|nr:MULTISPECIES: hypothetical protein [Pseudomonas]MBF7144483.1 hypothetical protein [Pseudomonas sp. LY10J]NJP03022.1 hypothetical protein [Pseudomonas quercus]